MGVDELGTDAEGNTKASAKGKRESVFHRLYVGTGAFDIVGVRKRWYIFFGALVLVCIASMAIRGFNLGIEFEGGTQIQMPANSSHGLITEQQAKDSFAKALGRPATEAQKVGNGAASTIQIRTDTLNA